ncbi:S26 family signal peptidase, partial [Deferrisoma sp.]
MPQQERGDSWEKIPEYAEALVVAILLAVAIRGAVVQAFKIPSGSMLPTLQIGDHLLVNKFLYG